MNKLGSRTVSILLLVCTLTLALEIRLVRATGTIYTKLDRSEMLSVPIIEDPTPGYFETSEYMIGRVGVGLIFLESNGAIDPDTEDWNTTEQQSVISKVEHALVWWASQNPGARMSFKIDACWNVSTSYEPISRPITDMRLWIDEAMTYLGYSRTVQAALDELDYVNDLREKLQTDWSFIVYLIDASNDEDGFFADDTALGFAMFGGPRVVMPCRGLTRARLFPSVFAHEMAHVFWATDEYDGKTEYAGYLNVSDVEYSGCLMDDVNWSLSEGTKGQIGWRDSDGDGIQDIVDTVPRVFVSIAETNNMVNCTGTSCVTPYANRNPDWRNQKGNVTINRIETVQLRIDNGEWFKATMNPTAVQKRRSNYYETKETYAIVNFTFLTPKLGPGEHCIEVKATDQWGNSGYANQTVTLQAHLQTDLNQDGKVNIQDITLAANFLDSYPGLPRWNPMADINKDNIVNIIDLVLIARDFGKTES